MSTQQRRNFTRDITLKLNEAGLIAASARAEVDGAAQILDMGDVRFDAIALIDVAALEIGSDDEIFDIIIQGSPDSDFGTAANIQDLAQLSLGAAGAKRSDSDKDDEAGYYELHVTNQVNETVYRYISMYIVVAGTIATGINFESWLCKQ